MEDGQNIFRPKYVPFDHAYVNPYNDQLHIVAPNYAGGISYQYRVKDSFYNFSHINIKTPSEHWVDGTFYDLEVQIYFNKNGSSPYVALAVFFDQEAEDIDNSNFIEAILDNGLDDESMVELLDAWNFFRDMSSWEFYQYDGSHTTPPCDEDVTWLVFSNPLKIEVVNLKKFLDKYWLKTRKVQSVGDWQIRKGFGTGLSLMGVILAGLMY